MNYAKLIRNNDDYLGDLEDTDKFTWADGMLSVPALQPSGDWQRDIRSYMANRSPQTGMKLRPRGEAVTGMGFALTTPKCVGILELLDVDPRITTAVMHATRTCLLCFELLAAPLKQKPDGNRRAKVVAFGAFQRFTDDSEPMPHRHVHAGVLSLAWNDDKKFNRVTSANLELVSHSGDLLQALFQHQLAWELRLLGYGIERAERSFTITGFPRNVVNRFCSGPRSREGKEYDFRPAGTFQQLRAHWQRLLSPAELEMLRSLGRPTPSVIQTASFVDHMKAAAKRSFEMDFFCPVHDIAVQALRNTFGLLPPDVNAVARWITGESLEGLAATKFEVDGQWCWASPAGLAEEMAFLDLIRGLPLADTGWLSNLRMDTWWKRQLATDRHRVAMLRADLTEPELATLEVDLGSTVRLVRTSETESLRRSARLWADSLRNNGRMLFVGAVDAPRQSLWVEQLPRDAGVAVLWEAMTQRLTGVHGSGLNISFGRGKSVEVFAAKHSQEKTSFLLTRAGDLAVMNLEIRRLLAANSKRSGKAVKRLALREAKELIRPGLLIQFETNIGGFRATELLTVLELGEDRMRVQRPGGMEAFVSFDHSNKYRVYQPQELELERGDRIRLTRNNCSNAIKSGLRRDRYFVVESVAADGTAYLDGGRVLPPEAGHWEYGFCLTFLDKPPGSCLAVCDAEDLPRLQTYWLDHAREIVVCAHEPAVAEQAVQSLLIKRNAGRRLPDTDELSVELAKAAFGDKDATGTNPEQNPPAPKPFSNNVAKPHPTEMKF